MRFNFSSPIIRIIPKLPIVNNVSNEQLKTLLPKINSISIKFYTNKNESFEKNNTSVNCNVGTIGHIDHGKTTLTSAITKYAAKSGNSKFVSYEDIDHAPEEKSRGITINIYHVGYNTHKRRYAHTDCPGHADFIKNMITGTSQMDGAILVVAATDGVMPQTREHLLLAKQIGIKKLVVYLNKADLVDKDILELVEVEVRETLIKYGYNGMDIPFVVGSALLALQGEQSELGEPSIQKLLDTLDDYIEIPCRDLTLPFYMPSDNILSIVGRGTIIIGTVKQGIIHKRSYASLMGYNDEYKCTVSEIQIFHKSVERAYAGDHCGILIKGIKIKELRRGLVLCAEKSVNLNNYFEAELYLLNKNEANCLIKPLVSNSLLTMYCDSWLTACRIDLPSDLKMLMPGEHSIVKLVILQKMPILLGQRFTIRQQFSNETIATGLITKIKEVIPFIHYKKIKQLKLKD
ncbi:hypothetical protein PGB90_008241 [Kerria lacca]